MLDSDSDIENIPLSTTQATATSPSVSSNSNQEQYKAEQLERLLKMSKDPKQYTITRNTSNARCYNSLDPRLN